MNESVAAYANAGATSAPRMLNAVMSRFIVKFSLPGPVKRHDGEVNEIDFFVAVEVNKRDGRRRQRPVEPIRENREINEINFLNFNNPGLDDYKL